MGEREELSSIVGDGMYAKNSLEKNKLKLQVPTNDDEDSEIIVAIDIGTAYSGFAYAIDDFTSSSVKVMKNTHGNVIFNPNNVRYYCKIILNNLANELEAPNLNEQSLEIIVA